MSAWQPLTRLWAQAICPSPLTRLFLLHSHHLSLMSLPFLRSFVALEKRPCLRPAQFWMATFPLQALQRCLQRLVPPESLLHLQVRLRWT